MQRFFFLYVLPRLYEFEFLVLLRIRKLEPLEPLPFAYVFLVIHAISFSCFLESPTDVLEIDCGHMSSQGRHTMQF